MRYYFCLTACLLSVFFCRAQQNIYPIATYGAVGDGKTLCTKAVQTAIDACNAGGGGEVRITTGIYMIGTVHLKSNVHLYLENGAVLRGSSHLADYEIFAAGPPFSPVHKGMLFTENAENVTISGNGQIDGNGNIFFDSTRAKTLDSRTTRFTRQKDKYRQVASGIGDGPIVPKDRPYQMFVFSNCQRVSIADIFVTNAPFWCMHFADCDAVKVNGIRLWNNLLAPNADGIDITSCSNVIISHCDIRSGDDALAIVGYDHHFEIPGFQGIHHISENIIISNCNLQSYSSGIRIGYLDQNTVRNIQVSNCNITNSTRGIGVFLRERGSLENISFNNIYIQSQMRTGDWWGNGEPIHVSAVKGVDSVTLGTIRNLRFSNITCKGDNGMLVFGSPDSRIQGLEFDHITFELTNSPLDAVAGGNVDLRGCLGDSLALFKRDIPGIYIRYADQVSLQDFNLQWTDTHMPFYTHGIEADHFNGLSITRFHGGPSPRNPGAARVFVEDGRHFSIDDKKNVVQRNIQ